SSSPPMTNCTIGGNTANYYGGGIFCSSSSSPPMTNCTISSNTANYHGGGIYCYGVSSSPPMTNCTISGNTAKYGGGGIYCGSFSSPTMTDCTISGNTAHEGGGIYCGSISSRTMTNCIINGNTATDKGGGIACYNSSLTLTNCTIADNKADYDEDGTGDGGGICCETNGSLTLTNCILWGDTAGGAPNEISEVDAGAVTVSYSDVDQDGYGHSDSCDPDSDSNIRCDPEFVPTADPPYTYYLAHTGPQAGNSPCVDAGLGELSDYDLGAGITTCTDGHEDGNDDGNGSTGPIDMGYHYEGEYTGSGNTYIELVSFTARPVGSSIVLTWETGAEIDNAGFVIYRAIAGTLDYQQISDLIAAEGSPSLGASYSFTDGNVERGVSYNYWLIDIETSGKWTSHGPVSVKLPVSLKLIELPTANRSIGGR
ncbi:MAG TPA: right-handed parallel beta-helix repeat-containing protein, partial [bacterium]|nr:right-handed parallel beta-helix repeat-containing protein [bacterium]